MTLTPVLLDSDTLSELSRGHPAVVARARDYLRRHGRLTLSAVTIFERLRGYRVALLLGKPFAPQLRAFQVLLASSVVLPVDAPVADVAATMWAHAGGRLRRQVGDVLIAATAATHSLALATRNRRDFRPLAATPGVELRLVDWTR
ncbi:MAG: PIN domain-containing protein [Deltaproteobacteria bacterium]|nr:PIN domain-containing protein [Deltaproteobacteria bacterium]